MDKPGEKERERERQCCSLLTASLGHSGKKRARWVLGGNRKSAITAAPVTLAVAAAPATTTRQAAHTRLLGKRGSSKALQASNMPQASSSKPASAAPSLHPALR